jgi:ABC-type sugar transport system substrate-binding protein
MKRLLRLLALLAAMALVISACGSDDDDGEAEGSDTTAAEQTDGDSDSDSDSDGDSDDSDDGSMEEDDDGEMAEGGEDDGLAAAAALVAQFNEPTTDIGPTIPLDSTPPEGKTVAWLACAVTCDAFNPGFERATELLGWNLEIIGIDSFDPGPGFQQALDLGVDYIAITGTPPALIQDQIDAAGAAGIPVMSCYEVTEPGQEANNIWTQCGDGNNVYNSGRVLSAKIIESSGGTAHELMVNIPDFPVLISEREGAESAYADFCPDTCQFTELAVTLDQLGAGEVPGAIVSAIQADPSITHVRFAFDALSIGASSVLADAGLLENVTLVGQDVNAGALQEIIDGTMEFWTTNPVQYAAFVMVDAMARHSVGQDNPEERQVADLPTYIVDEASEAEAILDVGDWTGPEGMDAQFAELWGVTA